MNSHKFIFNPAFNNLYGKTIDTVYLCGDFNDWSSNAMTYNAASNYYEFTLDLEDGRYAYKYQIKFSAPFLSIFNYRQTSDVLWYADGLSESYADDGWWGLNSIINFPYTELTYHQLSGSLSNVDGCETMFFVMADGYYQYFNALPQQAVANFDFKTSEKSMILLETVETNSYTNVEINRLWDSWYYTDVTSDTAIPPIDILYTNTLMIPGYLAVVSNGNIDFVWPLPTGLGSISNIAVSIQQTNNSSPLVFTTNLPGSATNYHFSGNANITGDNLYVWYIVFFTHSGWGSLTKIMPIYINNY